MPENYTKYLPKRVGLKKTRWRNEILPGWLGCKPVQYCVKGMKFTSVLQVPSSKNGRLLKMLAKAEPRIAKLTKYQVKYVEKSGRKLAKMFPVEPPPYRHVFGLIVLFVQEKPKKDHHYAKIRVLFM